MKQEINPKETSRAYAFEMWTKSPQPMVTIVKTFNVTRLYKFSKKRGFKFNMLLCWCIGQAASRIDEFYMLPEQGRLYRYDRLGINVIVDNVKGGISSCDIPYSEEWEQFRRDYDTLTQSAKTTCQNITDDGAMVVGTSAVVGTEVDCIVNQYTGVFNNPFLVWARYKRHLLKTTLPISFQFHHTQMDGAQAARFLNELQNAINNVSI